MKNFWRPNIKTNRAINRYDLETQMLLNAAVLPELFGVAQDSVNAGEKLLGCEFGFIVSFWNLQRQKHRVSVQNLKLVDFFVILARQISQNQDDWNPNEWAK